MPRRNRNAHAFTISADKLAAQAEQLTAEIGAVNDTTAYLVDEFQLYGVRVPPAGSRAILHGYFTRLIKDHPGCQLVVTDRKRELIEAVTGNGRD